MSLEYRDPDVLEELYWDQKKSLKEIGDEHDVDEATIHNWMNRHGIECRNPGRPRVERATYCFVDGYPEWDVNNGDEGKDWCFVHQLLACLGNDPHTVFAENTDVHHKSVIKRDNRAENLELMASSDHQKHHGNLDLPDCKQRVIQSATIMTEERA